MVNGEKGGGSGKMVLVVELWVQAAVVSLALFLLTSVWQTRPNSPSLVQTHPASSKLIKLYDSFPVGESQLLW